MTTPSALLVDVAVGGATASDIGSGAPTGHLQHTLTIGQLDPGPAMWLAGLTPVLVTAGVAATAILLP